MFGSKDKSAVPQAERKCPFYLIGGSSSSACIQGKCTFWQDGADACAFNVLAAAVAQDGRAGE
jgi:hypothetical protein